MASFIPRAAFLPAFLALLLCVGCSGKPTIKLNESVEGTVTLNGQPVPNVMVQFVPDIDSKVQAPQSSGITDEKGHFILKCDNNKNGAVIGKHNVIVLAGRPGGGDDESAPQAVQPRVTIPPAYTTVSKTPLKIEITADKHSYDLPLTDDGR